MANRPKIALIDLEFTLLNTWGVIELHAEKLAKERGISPSKEEIEAAVLGGKNEEIFGLGLNEFWDAYNGVFDERVVMPNTEVYPGAHMFLARLNDEPELTTAIFSDTPLERVHRYLDHFKLDGGFAHIHGWLKPRRHLHKPKLELSLEVLDKLGYQPGTRVYTVGDNNVDIEAAENLREAGIDARGVLIDTRDIQPKPKADYATTSHNLAADYILQDGR